MSQYWAYLHKNGTVNVKAWCSGNSYLDEARVSPYVAQFLRQPFEAISSEDAERIARRLLGVDIEPKVSTEPPPDARQLARTTTLALKQVGENSTTAKTDQPGTLRAAHWYCAVDPTKHMSQVVVNIPPRIGQASAFGTLMLSLQKYPIIMQTWCTTFFRLDGQPGPFLLVRADSIARELKTRPLAVAFSFFKFNSGGIFVIFVRVQDDSIVRRLKAKLPELQVAAIEGAMGLDDPNQVKRISDALQRDQLHIVVASNSASTMESFDPASGRSVKSTAPQAEFDIKLVIPDDIRKALQSEWQDLLAHHASIPLHRRKWNTIQQDYGDAMPLTAEPILADNTTALTKCPISETAAPKINGQMEKRPAVTAKRTWWMFWK